MYLPPNSQATVIDLLRGTIVQSGNDASKVIAEHMAGSEAGFAKLMNAEAQGLGMTKMNFVNSTDLPDPATPRRPAFVWSHTPSATRCA